MNKKNRYDGFSTTDLKIRYNTHMELASTYRKLGGYDDKAEAEEKAATEFEAEIERRIHLLDQPSTDNPSQGEDHV